ncbi:MAG: DUF3460 family protein [Burkholderiaceae bacterium]|nr:DUF3460 family protein [Burkholderiaceae bacterium]
MYKSEITRFLQQLKQERPHIEPGQREGRALLWDRPQDLDTMKRQRESRVPRSSYVYYPKDYT